MRRARKLSVLGAAVLACALCGATAARAVTWDNDSGDGLWSTVTNWSTDALPGTTDDVVFDGTSTDDCLADIVGDVQVGDIDVTSAYTGTVTHRFYDPTLPIVGGDPQDGDEEYSNIYCGVMTLGGGIWILEGGTCPSIWGVNFTCAALAISSR